MKYLGRQVNGQATRNNFIRSMDLASNGHDADAALAAYSQRWFSSRKKQYLNEAFKHVSSNSLFWPKKAFTDMLDEIVLDFRGTGKEMRAVAADADILKSKFLLWSQPRRQAAVTDQDLIAAIKQFEADYRYGCPDTYRSAWMNTGAYVTLCYGIKYENVMLPGCRTPDESLALLKKCALEVIAGMDHDVDDRMFRMCHMIYANRLSGPPAAAGTKA